jgi:hypothetical protein
MSETTESKLNAWEQMFLEEVEKARMEMELSEKAFSWVESDPKAIDAALSRIDAAREHLSFLIKKAKELGIKPGKYTVYAKLLQQYDLKN